MASKEEFDSEMARKNYTRAVEIAKELGLEREAEEAKDRAFKQYVGLWFNFRGAMILAREWGFDRERVQRLCDEIVQQLQEKQKDEGRELQVFDVERMDHTPVTKLVTRFRDAFR